MAGPLNIDDLRPFLPKEKYEGEYPKCLGGSPVGLLSAELLRRGHRMVIFTLDPGVKDEVVIEGERLKLCIGPYTYRPVYNFRHVDRRYLTNAILREKPDFVHAQWTCEFALGTQATGVPHLVTVHDAHWNVLRYQFNPYRIARMIMTYQSSRRAQRMVAVSPHVAGHMKRFGFHAKPVDVIPNGMPEKTFHRRLAPRHGDVITFATILMGWGGRKNGIKAIEAFAKVRRKLPAARLLMFGTGHGLGDPAEKWARQHGTADGIEFVGRVTHTELLRRLLEEVDIFVHPALEEAQPLCVIEAMSFGIPVIGGKSSGGVPWTLGDGANGLLVDVRSPDRIAEAMLRLAEDEGERARVGTAGQVLAKERFHIARVADQYEVIYRNVLNHGT